MIGAVLTKWPLISEKKCTITASKSKVKRIHGITLLSFPLHNCLLENVKHKEKYGNCV